MTGRGQEARRRAPARTMSDHHLPGKLVRKLLRSRSPAPARSRPSTPTPAPAPAPTSTPTPAMAPAPTPAEEAAVATLREIMGAELAPARALAALRAHGGNAESALNALFEAPPDAVFEDAPPDLLPAEPPAPRKEESMTLMTSAEGVTTGTHTDKNGVVTAIGPAPRFSLDDPAPPLADVIDLTADESDDDALQRALAASMELPATFGPSTRAPSADWAVVPASVRAPPSCARHRG
jgi:hypothetical protein